MMNRIGPELSRDDVLSLGIFHPQFGVREFLQPAFLLEFNPHLDPRISIFSGVHGDAVFVFGRFPREFPDGDFPETRVADER